MFPLDRLYKCLDRSRFTIECHESGEDVNVRGLIDDVIRDTPDYPELFDGEFRGGLPGKFYRERGRTRRNLLQRRDTSPIVVNINNHNQQEQEMSQDKQQNLHGDYIRGDKVMGDKDTVSGNKMKTGNVAGDAIAGNKIVTSQNLADAAEEIQELMVRLSQTYTTDTRAAKNNFADKIVRLVDEDPSLSQRLLSASKVGGIAAIEQFLNHPLASFVVAALEDWQNTKKGTR